MSTQLAEEFVQRWSGSGGSERANYQLFLAELCDLLGVEKPQPARPENAANQYVFERAINFTDGEDKATTNFIDLYKRGHFVCEAKQGVDQAGGEDLLSNEGKNLAKRRSGHGTRGTGRWDSALKKAREQGERYIRNLPAQEGRPPFLMVVDVGHVIELYSEFSRSGGNYVPFPDATSHRISLTDLLAEDVRERLKAVWEAPASLDPSRIAAKVTREIADKLAKLAKSFEADGHQPELVSGFLMRCLFTMFSEDVGLLPNGKFTELLESLKDDLDIFEASMGQLWRTMNTGGTSVQLRSKLLRFNGGLFADASALPVTSDQLSLLIEAAKADWSYVEPTIFGTLLERALNPKERHKLGAHYTPREYVERLVLPTVINPLREQWSNVEVAATQLLKKGDEKAAVKAIQAFLYKLTQTTILDPACGSGNFLYVTLEHLKRLEGEALDSLQSITGQLGFETQGITVDPHQLLGLEINPRAAAIADIVLWIGYLQWHYRTHGDVMPPEPVLRNFQNIKHQDALIDYDSTQPVLDEQGNPVTHWDGVTTKTHPVTGKQVPDETARRPEQNYVNPSQAEWPQADYIVGNPPFIGAAKMREALGDGYTTAVRRTYKDLPESIDFVMYWWHKAAQATRTGSTQRFGFITTNSIKQTFNRKVMQPHLDDGKKPLSLHFAIPDHPWVDAQDCAAVRISMTIGIAGSSTGKLHLSVAEQETTSTAIAVELKTLSGKINSDLSCGANTAASAPLLSNRQLTFRGMTFMGDGFILNQETAAQFLDSNSGSLIKPIYNGKDIQQSPRGLLTIDTFGLSVDELRSKHTAIYQHLLETVRPEREAKRGRNKDADTYADKWWLYAKPRESLRAATANLENFFCTVMTAKHRVFIPAPSSTILDQGLICVALQDNFHLGVLSGSIHSLWAFNQGGFLGPTPRYNNTRCFETFPFPDCDETTQQHIGQLAEQLDAHRKRQQAQHPKLTLTGMYNVLEKLRNGEALTAKEKTIHKQGLVSVLKELHDELDAAVCTAYGWPADISNNDILHKLVSLNAKRVAEEAQGHIRWLRPDFQNPSGKIAEAKGTQKELAVSTKSTTGRPKLPTDLPSRVAEIKAAVASFPNGADVRMVANCFKGAKRNTVEEVLETLVSVGKLQRSGELYTI